MFTLVLLVGSLLSIFEDVSLLTDCGNETILWLEVLLFSLSSLAESSISKQEAKHDSTKTTAITMTSFFNILHLLYILI